MHNWAKSIMECVKSKVDSMGMDNLTREDVEELKAWACIAESVAEYDYYYHITEAMEKPENEYGKNYDEGGRYYTQPRNTMGRFTSRGYEYDPSVRENMESYRDMDRVAGRMYYTDMNNMGNHSSNVRGYPESRYDRAKRGYEESKDMNPAQDNMREIQEIFTALKDDVKELKPKMSPTEKSFAKTELINLSNMM